MLRKSQNIKESRPVLDPAPISTPKPNQKTVIGEHIAIKGDIRGREDLIIEGSVQGSVQLEEHHLTIGSKGQVEAEIIADNVTISGRLVGNITARGKVEITKEADFTGEIKAKGISVQDGAYLKAVIELERESVPKPAAAVSAAPAKKTAPASADKAG